MAECSVHFKMHVAGCNFMQDDNHWDLTLADAALTSSPSWKKRREKTMNSYVFMTSIRTNYVIQESK